MSLLPGNFMSATWGANFVGTLLSCVSWGVLVAVAWNYFNRFPNDRLVYKGLAGLMLVLGTADTAINCHYTYDALINHFGEELYVLYSSWNFASNIVLVGVTCLILQGLMSYRIWVVSERKWRVYPACSIALSLAGAIISIWLSAWFSKQTLTLALATKPALVWCWFGFDTLSEFMSTLALNYFLVFKPRKVNNVVVLPGRSVLTRLAVRSVETNLLSLAVHLVIVILYAKHDTLLYWYSAPAFTIVKVYGISLLATLLGRTSEQATLSNRSASAGTPMRPDFQVFSNAKAGLHSKMGGATFDLELVERGGRRQAGAPPVFVADFVGAGEGRGEGAGAGVHAKGDGLHTFISQGSKGETDWA